jgi:hypothetical protein
MCSRLACSYTVTWVWLSLLLTPQTFAREQDNWLDKGFIKRAFYEVVLKSEFETGVRPLTKWVHPLRVYVIHNVPDKALHLKLLKSHFEQLTTLTKLNVSFVTERKQANFVVYFTKQSQWKSIVRKEMGEQSAQNTLGSICMFGIGVNRIDNSISRAVAVIPVDQAREHGKLISCIVEETTQSLGLANDSEKAFPSVFNDKTPEDYLSPLDVILTRLLYEPDIKPGMTKNQLEPILNRLIDRYRATGLLNRASADAINAPLFKQFGR